MQLRILSDDGYHYLVSCLHAPAAGQVIMASDCSLAKAPDGNGGVYMALRTSGILEKLKQEGGTHHAMIQSLTDVFPTAASDPRMPCNA